MKDILILFLIGLSLSVDAFTISLSINKNNNYYPVIVGIYHFIMPIIGNLINDNIILKLIEKTNYITGIIFIYLAIKTIIDINKKIIYKQLPIIYLGLLVSLDSLAVGVGIDNITNNWLMASFVFSLTSFLISYIGVKLGIYIKKKYQLLSNYLAILILFILGIVYLCK